MSSKSETAALVTSEQSEFAEFQKSEYEHIAEAHFKSIEAISYFFRYYLLVMSLPITVLAALFGIASRDTNFDRTAVSLIGLASPFLFAVGIVGFCMMVYIVNMKMDAVLYSRVVNSIRKFFYVRHDADYTNKFRMRLLPQTTSEPTYRDIAFWFVILAFAILDVLYLGVGFHLSYKTLIVGAASVKDLSFGDYN